MTPDERKVYDAEWRANNREKCREASRKWRLRNPGADVEKHLQRTYGITLAEYEALVAAQKGMCALCGGPPNGRVKKLVVDHDHSTERMRELLCDLCNRGLGMFREDPNLLKKSLEYLEKHKDKRNVDSTYRTSRQSGSR